MGSVSIKLPLIMHSGYTWMLTTPETDTWTHSKACLSASLPICLSPLMACIAACLPIGLSVFQSLSHSVSLPCHTTLPGADDGWQDYSGPQFSMWQIGQSTDFVVSHEPQLELIKPLQIAQPRMEHMILLCPCVPVYE